MSNKITKMILAIVVFFGGMTMVMADDCADFYPRFESSFKMLAALNYYYSQRTIEDEPTITPEEVATKFEIEESQKEQFITMANETKRSGIRMGQLIIKIFELNNICNNDYTTGVYCTDIEYKLSYRTIKLKEIINYASGFQSLTNTQRSFRETLDIAAQLCSRQGDYEKTINIVYQPINNFCDYLSSRKGVNYYVTLARKILTYSTLALALILSALDFVKAITSQDDAALTKAFKTSMKRLAAVVIIFLSYIIVQIILGLVTKIPNYNVNEMEICQELKMSGVEYNI